MTALLGLIPLAVVLALYTTFIKASARLQRFRVAWKHAFVFAVLTVAASLGLQFIAFLTGTMIPPVAGLMGGITLHLLLGCWFFSTRGSRETGEALAWQGAFRLVALAMCLLAVSGGVLILVGQSFGPPRAGS